MGVGREQTVRCARVALEAKLGRPLGEGMCALHHCDNSQCVRPEHLFEGTHADNLQDMARKCRGNTAKLQPGQADDIRRLVAQGWAQADIARAYGITPQGVNHYARAHS